MRFGMPFLISIAIAITACGDDDATHGPATPSPSPPPSPAPLSTALTLEGGPTHPLLPGASRRFTAADADFFAGVGCYENHIEVRVGVLPKRWTVALGAPRGQRLSVGSYENATTHPANLFSSNPGISVAGEGSGCRDVGRFVVLEAQYHPSGSVERFRATFEHRCDRFADVLHGEITLLNPPGAQVGCP